MNNLADKIENFLFDLLGLVLPGVIFIIVIVGPVYFIDIELIGNNTLESEILSFFYYLTKTILGESKKVPFVAGIIIFILIGYIFGHVVKVFSIIKYDFLSMVFDKSLNKLVDIIFTWMVGIIKKILSFFSDKLNVSPLTRNKIKDQIEILYSPVNSTLRKIFTFKSSSYFPENEEMKNETILKINTKHNTNFPLEWHSLYKFSSVLTSQEKIKTLAQTFLAKYNFYRSLAFIFFFNIFYLLYLIPTIEKLMAIDISQVEVLVHVVNGILWFTFHYKYKRYWTLCGNESLISIYYFITKP